MVQDRQLADSQRLQAMLVQVEALRIRINRLKARPESLATKDIHHRSTLRRLAWQHGTVALMVSCDSMRGLRLMASGVPRPVFAHLPLLRAAVDGASIARWLFDPTASTADRVQRGLRVELEDLAEQEKAQRFGTGSSLFIAPGEPAAQRLERVKKTAQRDKIVAAPRNQWVPTSLAARYASFPDGGTDSGAWLYAALSAGAHGRRWALQLANTKTDNPFDPLTGMTSWVDLKRVAALTAIVLDHLIVAIQDAERYAGLGEPT